MERLSPEKLIVEFGAGVTTTDPIIGRKYTLTHSDRTAELFLNIGLVFAYDEISEMRDEVLAEWGMNENGPVLYGYVHVDGESGAFSSAIRNAVFRRELPLALEAIVYGDRNLFIAHPELEDAPIWIKFDSSSPNYNQLEYWGTPKDYQ